jgi:acyl carrier protein
VLLEKHVAKERRGFDQPIADDMSFDYIGLDSLARVELLAGLEECFAVPLDPTAAYDFVTVRALSEFVWSAIKDFAESGSQVTRGRSC